MVEGVVGEVLGARGGCGRLMRKPLGRASDPP